MTGIRRLLFSGLWVGCAAALTGCYGDIKDYCEKEAACEGGNENDEKACVEEMKGMRDAAKEYDCKDQFDEAMECEVDNGYCDSQDNYFTSGDACNAEEDKYYACLVANSNLYASFD